MKSCFSSTAAVGGFSAAASLPQAFNEKREPWLSRSGGQLCWQNVLTFLEFIADKEDEKVENMMKDAAWLKSKTGGSGQGKEVGWFGCKGEQIVGGGGGVKVKGRTGGAREGEGQEGRG